MDDHTKEVIRLAEANSVYYDRNLILLVASFCLMVIRTTTSLDQNVYIIAGQNVVCLFILVNSICLVYSSFKLNKLLKGN
jgi:hypothetical protein